MKSLGTSVFEDTYFPIESWIYLPDEDKDEYIFLREKNFENESESIKILLLTTIKYVFRNPEFIQERAKIVGFYINGPMVLVNFHQLRKFICRSSFLVESFFTEMGYSTYSSDTNSANVMIYKLLDVESINEKSWILKYPNKECKFCFVSPIDYVDVGFIIPDHVEDKNKGDFRYDTHMDWTDTYYDYPSDVDFRLLRDDHLYQSLYLLDEDMIAYYDKDYDLNLNDYHFPFYDTDLQANPISLDQVHSDSSIKNNNINSTPMFSIDDDDIFPIEFLDDQQSNDLNLLTEANDDMNVQQHDSLRSLSEVDDDINTQQYNALEQSEEVDIKIEELHDTGFTEEDYERFLARFEVDDSWVFTEDEFPFDDDLEQYT